MLYNSSILYQSFIELKQVQINKLSERKIIIILLSICLNMCFGAQKNRLIETVLLSTHNICFGSEIWKKYFWLRMLI